MKKGPLIKKNISYSIQWNKRYSFFFLFLERRIISLLVKAQDSKWIRKDVVTVYGFLNRQLL